MATVALSTSPTQIDAGSSYSVLVANTGSSPVELSRGGRLRPGQTQTVYPEGSALTAVSLSGVGQVTTTTVAGKPLPNPSDPSTLATDPAFSGTYARVTAPTAVLFGDSRTADGYFTDATHSYTTNLAWFDWGQARNANGPVYDVTNKGVGGNTTTQMLARVSTDLIALAPRAATVWGGTNDGWATTTDVDASYANIVSICDQARAAGIYVFLITETPKTGNNTFNALLPYFNEKLKAYAAANKGIEVWDFYSLIVDPASATGAPLAIRLRADGLHLNVLGAAKAAEYVAGKLARFGAVGLASPPTSLIDARGVNANSVNICRNPLMTGTGGTKAGGDTGSVPDNWTVGGSPPTTCSIAARSDGYGNDLQLVVAATSSSGKTATHTLTASDIVAGGTYVLEAAIGLGTVQNLNTVWLTATVTVSGTAYQYGWGPNAQTPIVGDGMTALASGVIRSPRFTIPAGTVTAGQIDFGIRHSTTGTSTLTIGRVAMKRVA